MKQKFKVGDRVMVDGGNEGTVVFVDIDHDGPVYKVFIDSWGEAVELFENAMRLIRRTNTPTPDRAMIAAMCLQEMLTNTWTDLDRLIKRSVELADALIAELQKPQQ